MAWPVDAVDTTNMDNDLDSPDLARPEIKKMADNVNAMKDSRGAANGIPSLDAGGKIPVGQLPTQPANQGGTGQVTYTVGDILYASAAGVLSKLSAGANGYVLKSNGPGMVPSWQQEGGGMPSGTRMAFQQTAAPTGWTKDLTSALNNSALRIVTGAVGSGGTDAFTTVFAASRSSGAFTLTEAHIPSHTHGMIGLNKVNNSATGAPSVHQSGGGGYVTGGTGGGGSHSHTMPSMDLKYYDVIIATKD
jgi:hypothetical protein